MTRVLAFAIFAFLGTACGAGAKSPNVVALKAPHVRSIEQRRADVCARADLVPLGVQILATASHVDEKALVGSVHVRDASNREIELREEATSAIHVGAPLTREAGRETIRHVWQTGKFDDVAIEAEPENGGISVIVRVVPKRTIANVFVASEAEPDALHVASGMPYDAVAIASAKHSVLDFERGVGHLDATLDVSSAFADDAHSGVDVCVKLVRGPRVTVGAINIHGSALDATLSDLVAREDKSNVPDHVIDNDVLERDQLLMAAELYDHGLLEHAIKRTTSRRGDSVIVDFAVTDGATFHYGLSDVRGDLAAPKGDYMKLVTLKQGDVFKRSDVMAVLEKIRALDKASHHEDIEVEPATELDVPTQRVALTIVLHDPHAVAAPPVPLRGFSIVELAPGAGRAAKVGDTVYVHYKGTLKNGTVFDDSHGRSPFTFKIGGGSVIKGFDAGVIGMKVGGKRRVTIPPDMAYGTRAMGNIPASSVLVFEIELLSIQ